MTKTFDEFTSNDVNIHPQQFLICRFNKYRFLASYCEVNCQQFQLRDICVACIINPKQSNSRWPELYSFKQPSLFRQVKHRRTKKESIYCASYQHNNRCREAQFPQFTLASTLGYHSMSIRIPYNENDITIPGGRRVYCERPNVIQCIKCDRKIPSENSKIIGYLCSSSDYFIRHKLYLMNEYI